MASALRGMRLSVYTNKLYRGCSLNGISERCTEVTLVGDDVPPIFDVTPDAPAVELVERQIGNELVLHVEPLTDKPTMWMAGGAYVASSDSRIGELLRKRGHSGYCAINLHDRNEVT